MQLETAIDRLLKSIDNPQIREKLVSRQPILEKEIALETLAESDKALLSLVSGCFGGDQDSEYELEVYEAK